MCSAEGQMGNQRVPISHQHLFEGNVSRVYLIQLSVRARMVAEPNASTAS